MSCSNPEAAEGKMRMPRREPVAKGICSRCREAKSLYTVRTTTFCRPCFESNLSGRMAFILHPALLPPSAPRNSNPRKQPLDTAVLVALSGGAGSTAMVQMLFDRDYYVKNGQVGFDYRSGGRPSIWNGGYAVHVDFSGVVAMDSQTERLKRLAEERGLTFVGVRAEDAFDPAFRERIGGTAADGGHGVLASLAKPGIPLIVSPSTSTASPMEQLQTLLATLPPPSRPALLANILNALLACVAETLPNVSHLLVGETSTREAQRVISGTASGRGWALPLELARACDLPTSTKVVRIKAMKAVSLKEAAIWCHVRGLQTVNERRWDSAAGGARRDARGKGTIASIEALTERFVANLSVSHPSTVTTINKTGDKLRFTGSKDAPLCPVCEMFVCATPDPTDSRPVDPSPTKWKAQAALTSLPAREEMATASVCDPCSAPEAASDNDLTPLLCYACLTTFTPLSAARKDQPTEAVVPLPLWVGERVSQRRVTQDEMRSQVAEFLLE